MRSPNLVDRIFKGGEQVVKRAAINLPRVFHFRFSLQKKDEFNVHRFKEAKSSFHLFLGLSPVAEKNVGRLGSRLW